MIKYLIIIGIITTLLACGGENNDVLNRPTYNGPVSEAFDITNFYSDSAVVKLKFQAPVVLEFANGDMEYSDGIYLEFYDKQGQLINTLRADYCYYYSDKNEYKATGDVVMRGLKNKEQLNTEELFWDQKEEIVYTEEFVRIETENEIITGTGLEAAQDFSWYTIKNSGGTILLDE